jgi:hypothetical protein
MFGSTIQLAVFRNRLRLTDVKTGTVIERNAIHLFSTASMLIANRETLEREFGELVRQIPRSRLFAYPTVEVVATEAALEPVEREALQRAIADAGAAKVILPDERH